MKITFKQRTIDIGMVIPCVTTILSAWLVLTSGKLDSVGLFMGLFFSIPATLFYIVIPMFVLCYLYENWNVPKS